MATIKLKLKKLTDVDVEFVSLVKRGANRIPFRVIKSDDIKQENTEESTMSFLDKLFGTGDAVKEESKPEITAIIVNGNCNIDDVEAQLKEVGFSVTEKEEVEGGLVFRQSEFSEEDTLVRLTENAFITVRNVQKAFEPFASGTSFADNFNKGAFFPSVRMATDVLMDTIVNVMFTSDGNKAPTESINKTLEEFNSFVLASLKSIPRDAFKLEDIMVKAEKSASLGNENVVKTEDETVDIEKLKSELGDLLKTDAEKAVAKMEEIKKSIHEGMVAVKDEMEKKFKSLESDLKALKDVSEGFDKRLEKSETKAEEIEKAVKGTVATGSLDNDPEKVEDKTKSDEENVDPWGGVLSTLDDFSLDS